jgi:hypothetical protein
MIVSSNLGEVLIELKGKLLEEKQYDKLALSIAQALFVGNLKRIHNQGLAVDLTSIGRYSTKSTYINPRYSPQKFQPIGKTGRTTFANGRSHRTRYFGAGYKEFRSVIGRETANVNLQLSGLLKADFQVEKSGNSYILGFMSEYGSRVAAGNEAHFGKMIYGISSRDVEEISKIEQEFRIAV